MKLLKFPRFRLRVKKLKNLKRLKNIKKEFNLKKIIKYFFLVTIVFLVIFIIYSYFSITRIEFAGRKAQENLHNWDLDREINIFLIGFDEDQENRKFIDFLQIINFKPNTEIIYIDPTISISFVREGDFENIVSTYKYKQLYNYYFGRGYDHHSSLELAIKDIEKDIGVKFDRYLCLGKKDFVKLMKPYDQKILINNQIMSIEDQLNSIISFDKKIDEKLYIQSQITKNYLVEAKNPLVIFGLFINTYQKKDEISKLVDTNFTSVELFSLFKGIVSVPDFKINIDYTEEKNKYNDSGNIFLNKKYFDKKIKKITESQEILFEQARIDLINGSGKSRLASKTQRLLDNYGFNIVRIDNAEDIYARNTLYVTEKEKFTYTIQKLKFFFPDLEIKQEIYPHRPTGDMVLVVI